MADDPPLDDIVSKTYEWGASGRLTSDVNWNAAIYHAMNHDDIHFINNNAQNGLGYFDNVGRTRRDGLDVGMGGNGLFGYDFFGQGSKISWSGSYSYVNATYDSDLELVSDGNTSRTYSQTSYNSFDDDMLLEDSEASEALEQLHSLFESDWLTDISDANLGGGSPATLSATDASTKVITDGGQTVADFAEWIEDEVGLVSQKIDVKKGDRLANIPQHRLKLRLNYDAEPNLRFGLTGLAYGKSYMMGNENQKHQGDGENPGYMIFNADMSWSPAKNWLVSLKAINLLDKNYYNGGRLLMNGFDGGNTNAARDEVFRGVGVVPGSPQAAWITVGYSFK
jgi:outer membrane receptor protein involved in Fe transport